MESAKDYKTLEELEKRIEEVRDELINTEQRLEEEKKKLEELSRISFYETGTLKGEGVFEQNEIVDDLITKVVNLEELLDRLEQ